MTKCACFIWIIAFVFIYFTTRYCKHSQRLCYSLICFRFSCFLIISSSNLSFQSLHISICVRVWNNFNQKTLWKTICVIKNMLTHCVICSEVPLRNVSFIPLILSWNTKNRKPLHFPFHTKWILSWIHFYLQFQLSAFGCFSFLDFNSLVYFYFPNYLRKMLFVFAF